MFTGKILTTLVAITTAVILLSQLNASSEIIPDIYEPYVNYALRPVLSTSCEKKCHEKRHKLGNFSFECVKPSGENGTYTCRKINKPAGKHKDKHGHHTISYTTYEQCLKACHSHNRHKHHHRGKKLTGPFSDDVFVSSNQFEPTSVMGTGTSMYGNAVGMSGLGMQALANSTSPENTEAAFANYETAAGVVREDYREDYGNNDTCTSCRSSPCNCGSGSNGYGQQTMPANDYSAFDDISSTLPIAGLNSYSLPAGEKDEMNAQGEIQSVICRSRLMYSTLRRYGSHVGDPIRGDIPVMGCQTQSRTAATASDSLNAGAFGVMNGIDAETPQLVALQITEGTGGAVTTLGGMDLSEAVSQGPSAPALTESTFLNTSAKLFLEATNGAQPRVLGTSGGGAEVAVVGYSGY